jgi:outer membrane protein TolC
MNFKSFSFPLRGCVLALFGLGSMHTVCALQVGAAEVVELSTDVPADSAQPSGQLTLEECKQAARANYPLIRQLDLISRSRDYNVSNAAKAWLPQVNVSAAAGGFTDILSLSEQLSQSVGDPKNWLAGASVMVNQNIYDGGETSVRKQMARQQAEVDQRSVEVRLYDINQRVEQLYFGVLVLDEQLRQNQLLLKDLSLSMETVKSMLNGGLANQGDVEAVKVAQVETQQQQSSLKTLRQTYIAMLGTFIGRNLPKDVVLPRPADLEVNANLATWRPELDYYQSQENLLQCQKRELDARLKPRLNAFAMGLTHSNIISALHNSMLAGGITLSWNIGSLYTRKNDLRNLEVKRQQIDTDRMTFLFNNNMESQQQQGVIDNLQRQLTLDDEIVSLRQSIRAKSEKKVRLGTESVNEMLRDINAAAQARQQKALHEVELLEAKYKLRTLRSSYNK